MSEELKNLIEKCRVVKEMVNSKNSELKELKEQIRVFMIDSGIDKCEGVEVRRSFSSFDLELLRLENPELFERYATREKQVITTFDNKITKEKLKLLQKEHPELWNDPDYRKELTARLYGL